MKQHAICTIFALCFVCCAPKTPPTVNDAPQLDVPSAIDVTQLDAQPVSEDTPIVDRDGVAADSPATLSDVPPTECDHVDAMRRLLEDQAPHLQCGVGSPTPSVNESDRLIQCVAAAWMARRPFWVYVPDPTASDGTSYALIGRQTAHGFECVQLIARLGPDGASHLRTLDVIRSRMAPSLERRTYNGPNPLHQGEFFTTGFCPADPTYAAEFASEVEFDPPRSLPVGRVCPRAR